MFSLLVSFLYWYLISELWKWWGAYFIWQVVITDHKLLSWNNGRRMIARWTFYIAIFYFSVGTVLSIFKAALNFCFQERKMWIEFNQSLWNSLHWKIQVHALLEHQKFWSIKSLKLLMLLVSGCCCCNCTPLPEFSRSLSSVLPLPLLIIFNSFRQLFS